MFCRANPSFNPPSHAHKTQIAGASITPLAGRLCQIFSPRAYILVSSFIMATGALITCLSSRLAFFLIGRAVNGIGGAAVFPVSLILIIELTGMKRRGIYLGCVNTCYTIGVACGAIIAGALESVIGWRGIFAVQVPLALIVGVGIFLAIPSSTFSEQHTATKPAEPLTTRLSHIDFLGVLLLITTISLFLYGLSTPHITYPPILVSLFTLLAFLIVESKNTKFSAEQPILPLTILLSLPVLLTCLSTLFAMISRWSILFYTPVYALSVRSFPPAKAGLILLPTNGGFALGNLLLGYFHVRRPGSFYASCLVVYALFALSVFAIAMVTTRDVGMGWYFAVAGINGFMIGASMIYTLTHVLHRTPKESHFIVSSLIAMFRSLSASFGSAIGGGIFLRILNKALKEGFEERGVQWEGKKELIRRLLGSPALVAKLVGVEREVAIGGYVVALRTLFMTSAVLAAVAVVVQGGTGWRGVIGEDWDGGKIGGGNVDGMGREEAVEAENLQIGARRD
jgi:predicted MFS family arabinose efflux permease